MKVAEKAKEGRLTRFCWKRISDGRIAQQECSVTAEGLFLAAGFGAVNVDKSITGMLAVECENIDDVWTEI